MAFGQFMLKLQTMGVYEKNVQEWDEFFGRAENENYTDVLNYTFQMTDKWAFAQAKTKNMIKTVKEMHEEQIDLTKNVMLPSLDNLHTKVICDQSIQHYWSEYKNRCQVLANHLKILFELPSFDLQNKYSSKRLQDLHSHLYPLVKNKDDPMSFRC